MTIFANCNNCQKERLFIETGKEYRIKVILYRHYVCSSCGCEIRVQVIEGDS